MRRIACSPLLLVGALMAVAAPAAGQEKPVQIALFTPVQIFDAGTSIRGIRWNVLYGRNAGMTGLDVGLVNHVTGDATALQFGLVGIVEGDFTGLQWNYVNVTEGRVKGFQAGIYNRSSAIEGLHWGAVNDTGRLDGLAIGLINIADDAEGLQVGLINIIRSKDRFPILPLVNWKGF